MDEETVEKIKKFLAIIAACGAWIISIVFSNQGFNFQVHNMIWAGWVLSFIITVIELVFNSQLKYRSSNYSIYVLGAFSYLYDVGTNLIGLWIAGGNGNISMDAVTSNFIGFAIYIFIAGLIAVAPEMLLVYALVGITGSGEGDLIRNVLQIRDKNHNDNNHGKQNNNGKGNNNQQHNNNNGQNNHRNEDHDFEPLPEEYEGMSRREARQQQGQSGKHQHQLEPSYRSLNGGNLSKKDKRNLRG